MINDKTNEVLTTVFGTISASTLALNVVETIDILWKIVAIISGIIAIATFVIGKFKKFFTKIKEAKADGKITNEEVQEIFEESKQDIKETVDYVKDKVDNIKDEVKR